MIIYAELSYHIEALRGGLLLRTNFYKSGGLLIETIQMITLVCSWLRRVGNASQGVSLYFIKYQFKRKLFVSLAIFFVIVFITLIKWQIAKLKS